MQREGEEGETEREGGGERKERVRESDLTGLFCCFDWCIAFGGLGTDDKLTSSLPYSFTLV